jgi:hypothetical protein
VVTLEPEPLPECVKPNACPTGSYDHGTTIKLEAKPAEGSTFKQWSLTACGTNPICEFPLMADSLVVATFDVQSYAFTPGIVGPAGSVSNLLCTVEDALGEPQTNACVSTTYAHGTAVTVTAAPAANNELASWGQACAGKPVDQPCSLVITGVTNVLATFQKKKFPVTLTFNSIEGGTGSVTGGLTCASGGGECTTLVEYGSDLTIAAVEGPNSVFDGFIGCEGAASPCELEDIDGPRNVTVTFKSATSNLYTLFVSKVNGQGGTVTGGGGQINCGATCSAGFTANSTVNLTVTSGANYDFTAFSGGTCALNQGTCSVTMDANGKQFSATFTPKNYPVVVAANAGNGVGRITGSIEGIADKIECGQGATDCSANLPYGRTLVLTAQPQVPPAGHSEELVTWGGVCANAVGNTCQFVVGAGTNQVGANFYLRKYLLSIQLHGDGAAGNDPLVTGNGLACTFKGQGTSDCQVLLTALTPINLTAKAPRWAQFKGFGGACSGGSCSYTLTSNKPVDALFQATGALAFVTAEPRSGMIDDPKLLIPRGARAGDDICQNLADAQGLLGTWKAWLSDGNAGPAKRLQNLTASTPIVALNGDLVVKGGWGSIGEVKMNRSLSVTETGAELDARLSFIPVWTATSPKGEPILEDAAYCGSAGAPPKEPARFWSSKDPNLTIRYGVGNALALDGAWTFNPNGFGGGILIPLAPPPGIACDTQARLYCFQDVIWPAPAPQ